MALIDSTGIPVPIARPWTRACLTPTVIPYALADAARLAVGCIPETLSRVEQGLNVLELRGVSISQEESLLLCSFCVPFVKCRVLLGKSRGDRYFKHADSVFVINLRPKRGFCRARCMKKIAAIQHQHIEESRCS